MLFIDKNLLCKFWSTIAHDANTKRSNIHLRKSGMSTMMTRAWDKNMVSEIIVSKREFIFISLIHSFCVCGGGANYLFEMQ